MAFDVNLIFFKIYRLQSVIIIKNPYVNILNDENT